MRRRAGGLGLPVKVLNLWSSQFNRFNLQSLSNGSQQAGLLKELVLYCARHDYGTRVLTRTENLADVMRTMRHRDVTTAMHYQHPELENPCAPLSMTVRQLLKQRCSGGL